MINNCFVCNCYYLYSMSFSAHNFEHRRFCNSYHNNGRFKEQLQIRTSFMGLIGHPISEALLKLNSSVNFFIYCAFNNCFRKAMHNRFSRVFTLCRRRQSFSTRTRTSSNDSRTIHEQTNATTIDATELNTLNNASHQASLIQQNESLHFG